MEPNPIADPEPVDPGALLARGQQMLFLLLTNGIDPLLDPTDLLVLELIGIATMRALGVEDQQLREQLDHLTTIAESINIDPLRQLIERRRAATGGAGGDGDNPRTA